MIATPQINQDLQILRERKKDLEDKLTVFIHNCLNDFMNETGVIVDMVYVNINPVFKLGYKKPTTLIVDVEARLEI